MKNKIVIEIEDGMVQAVFATQNMDVEIIDFDTSDPDELEATQQRANEVYKSRTLKSIY